VRLRIITWIMAFLIFIISPPAVAGPDQQNPAGFTDIYGHWASEAIILCNIYGFMDGYPDKQFKPDNNLSRAEALTLIGRSLGWSFQTPGKTTVESGTLSGVWKGFRGFIELAADKQLISRDDINTMDFGKPATRLEVSVWLARALNIKGNGSALKFSDLYTVPVSHLNPLAGVVEAGIITGLPGNRFNPSSPLTRAEMAAILLKMVDGGKITPVTGHNLVGKLLLKDQVNNKISIQTTHGTFNYAIAPYFMAFLYGSASSLDLINVGDNVRVTLNRAQKCQIISYYSGTTPATSQIPPSQGAYTYSGIVKSIGGGILEFQLGDGVSLKLPLSPAVRVSENGNSVALSSITGGKRGSITLSEGRIIIIDINFGSTSTILSGNKGHVINKYGDSFSIRREDGTVQVIWLASGVIFRNNGAISSYSSLKSGMYVELTNSGQSVQTINILDSSRKFFGSVEWLTSDLLAFRDDDNKSLTRSLSPEVQIRDSGGFALKTHEIRVGSNVEITLDSNDVITAILIRESYGNPDGTVEEIWAAGSRRITIADSYGSRRSYYMRENVTVSERGVARNPDYVAVGMKVRLTRDGYDYVTGIEIITDSWALEGRITYISYYGSGQIQIQKSSGRSESYYLAESVLVRDGGSSSRSINYLTEGMNVRLTLDSANRVTVIDITASELEGLVTYFQRTGSRRIEIRRNNGVTGSYYLSDSVLVREGSADRNPDYLTENMNVSLTLDSRSYVTRIDITNSYAQEGRITYVSNSSYGSGQIQIQKSSGRTESYYLSAYVQVRDGSTSRSINSLTEGMNVRLTLDSANRVTVIDITGSELIEGVVTYIRRTGSRRIDIRRNNGVTGSYYLSDSVLVREGYIDRNTDYITENMNVSLTLDSRSYVTRIDITTGSYAAEGRVIYFSSPGTGQIQIQTANGRTESYYLAASVQVREGSVSHSINYLTQGMNVRLTLDNANRVTVIDITGSAVIEGVVTYVRSTGSRRIEVRTDAGRLEPYYLPESITVRDWGVARSLDTVRVGMRVKIYFDVNETPTRIEITG